MDDDDDDGLMNEVNDPCVSKVRRYLRVKRYSNRSYLVCFTLHPNYLPLPLPSPSHNSHPSPPLLPLISFLPPSLPPAPARKRRESHPLPFPSFPALCIAQLPLGRIGTFRYLSIPPILVPVCPHIPLSLLTTLAYLLACLARVDRSMGNAFRWCQGRGE